MVLKFFIPEKSQFPYLNWYCDNSGQYLEVGGGAGFIKNANRN